MNKVKIIFNDGREIYCDEISSLSEDEIKIRSIQELTIKIHNAKIVFNSGLEVFCDQIISISEDEMKQILRIEETSRDKKRTKDIANGPCVNDCCTGSNKYSRRSNSSGPHSDSFFLQGNNDIDYYDEMTEQQKRDYELNGGGMGRRD